MYLNKAIIIGHIGERGAKLTTDERGTAICSCTVEVDSPGPSARVFTSYILVEIVGKHDARTAAQLHAGDEVRIDRELRYRQFVNQQTVVKTSKLVVSSCTATHGTPAPTPVTP